ncbi:MAG: endonuclease V [Armatimonadota bacterium]|nr:endonuclease V [Armatimonadota bacterium]MDR7486124.1 endonuclease V [Armatimonadota bacterium]MDR7531755.1 endonuclease V [Armatimonadota bacterium]MDR7534900.1 endonuclease V [Armatimonadota bacterium]
MHQDEPWPTTPEALIALQEQLGRAAPAPWAPAGRVRVVAGCFICFARHKVGAGAAGDPGWAAAALLVDGRLRAVAQVRGAAGAPYAPGLLALREGPLLEAAVRGLPARPEVLLVNATGRDHPRRAGLAVHLGARLDLPTIGVTSRPLVASGALPADAPGARSPLVQDGEHVGYWVRVHPGVRPLAVHAAWRTDPEVAAAVTLAATGPALAPEPLRQARRAAREARAADACGG